MAVRGQGAALPARVAWVLALWLGLGCFLSCAGQMRTCAPKDLEQLVTYLTTTQCQLIEASAANFLANEDSAKQLTTALLKSTTIEGFSAVRCQLNLAFLDALANALASGLRLQQLDLSHNRLPPAAVIRLAQAMRRAQSVEVLNLMNAGIDDDVLAQVGADLGHGPLRDLNLARNAISEHGIEALAQPLRERKLLQKLDLSMNPLGDRGVVSIAVLISEVKSLRHLSLAAVQSEVIGARALAATLRQGKSQLQVLIFSKNKQLGVVGGEVFQSMLVANPTIKYLDLSMNALGTAGVQAVLRGVGPSRTLQQLLLAVNDAGDGILPEFVSNIIAHPTLEALDLSYNLISEQGAMNLEKVLVAATSASRMGTLRKLYVRRNAADHATLQRIEALVAALPKIEAKPTSKHAPPAAGADTVAREGKQSSSQSGTCDASSADCETPTSATEAEATSHGKRHYTATEHRRSAFENLERNLIIVLALARLERLADAFYAADITTLAGFEAEWRQDGGSSRVCIQRLLDVQVSVAESDKLDVMMRDKAPGLILAAQLAARNIPIPDLKENQN